MAKIGSVGSFEVVGGSWESYIDRLEMFFVVNDIKPAVRLPTLISSVGEVAYELMVNVCSPRKPAECAYGEVVQLMRDHLQPKRSEVAERFKFRQCRQQAATSVAQYVATLKEKARYCNFGPALQENLRDQFVCGVFSEMTRQRLFAEDTLDWQRGVAIATALEAAELNAAVVEKSEVPARGETALTAAGASDFHSVNAHECGACGSRQHNTRRCKFINYECSYCREIGHLRRVCRAMAADRGRGAGRGTRARRWRGGSRTQRVNTHDGTRSAHWLEDGAVEGEDESGEAGEALGTEVFQMSLGQYRAVSVPIQVHGHIIDMEIDTGSAISCVSKQTYQDLFYSLPLQNSNISLRFYDGTQIKPIGVLDVSVKYKDKICKKLDLYVIDNGTTNLLGRQWLAELNIVIPQFTANNYNKKSDSNNDESNIKLIVSNILCNYSELFESGLGRYTGGCAELRVRPGVAPVFCRARPLPYALRDRVDAEIDLMLRAGVIDPVDCSEWATPLVIVNKPDGSLRICADYKVTLNSVLLVDKYPLPKIDDLLTQLNGSRYFTKLDLSQAYNQIELAEQSKAYTVINTHRGLFRYNRLVYGLASSPGIFQRIMMQLVHGIAGVVVFLDDILITGKTLNEHQATVQAVLRRLQISGLRIKKSKCVFFASHVTYLGYIIGRDGIRVDKSKLQPILDMRQPENVSELRSFLGMVNFYSKFINNLSELLSPLHMLLKKQRKWRWEVEQVRSFEKVKRMLCEAPVLNHYDPNAAVVLTCDASAHGLGAVLAQPGATGGERAIAYASRALTEAERNYSQIHKEALAIVYAVKKYHQYLYGRKFLLRTDHKPLVSIFSPRAGIPKMTASRLQRWALFLAAYDFDIEYVKTDDNIADALSRMISSYREGGAQEASTVVESIPEQTYLHFASDALLLDYTILKEKTASDSVISRVAGYIRDGWPKNNEEDAFRPYLNRRDELYVELGCVMWGHRVVIPTACRNKVLHELHESHMGIVRTKQIARSYVWWPGIDEAIETMVKACEVCASVADSPPAHVPRPWGRPDRPWARLHIDFLGPIGGVTYMVVVDAYSKWIECERMNGTAATSVMYVLRKMWARFGLPKQLVSDNGPPFTSGEFEGFLRNNGIEHVLTAPYHPSSNGAAENAVKICKKVIKRAWQQKVDVEAALSTYLLMHHNVEHPTTGECPAMLLQGRHLRTRLDALKPDREARVRQVQQRQQAAAGGSTRTAVVGDVVWYREYRGQRKWREGEVVDILGGTNYLIRANDGSVIHRHVDQIKRRTETYNKDSRPRHTSLIVPEGTLGGRLEQSSPGQCDAQGSGEAGAMEAAVVRMPPDTSLAGGRRYPDRNRHPPARFGFEGLEELLE